MTNTEDISLGGDLDIERLKMIMKLPSEYFKELLIFNANSGVFFNLAHLKIWDLGSKALFSTFH